MATIRATCPSCGDVDLTIEAVKVLVCSSTNAGSYCFRCPTCTLAVSKAADSEVVDLLLGAGVPLALWNLPAELGEAKSGPPITYDDVLALHFELQDDSRLRAIVEAVPPASA